MLVLLADAAGGEGDEASTVEQLQIGTEDIMVGCIPLQDPSAISQPSSQHSSVPARTLQEHVCKLLHPHRLCITAAGQSCTRHTNAQGVPHVSRRPTHSTFPQHPTGC